MRQAVLQLEDLDKNVQPQKWAKNHAFDGRKENRREMKAHEEEQATRLQLFADAQQYPFEVCILPPRSSRTKCSHSLVFFHMARQRVELGAGN